MKGLGALLADFDDSDFDDSDDDAVPGPLRLKASQQTKPKAIRNKQSHSETSTNPTSTPAFYPQRFHLLIRQQTAIGWRQIFNGRMSTEWNRLQADYDFNNRKSDYHTLCLWTTNIVCNIWNDWYHLWELRNGVIHGHDSTSCHKAKRDLAEKEICMIYDSRDTMLPADRDHHLEDDVEDHITGKTTKRLQNWLNTYRGLFKKSISEAKK